ncbi:MAG: hypothetical protein ACFFFH_07070 [Candidatus Thorarchaeota archaeon]
MKVNLALLKPRIDIYYPEVEELSVLISNSFPEMVNVGFHIVDVLEAYQYGWYHCKKFIEG